MEPIEQNFDRTQGNNREQYKDLNELTVELEMQSIPSEQSQSPLQEKEQANPSQEGSNLPPTEIAEMVSQLKEFADGEGPLQIDLKVRINQKDELPMVPNEKIQQVNTDLKDYLNEIKHYVQQTKLQNQVNLLEDSNMSSNELDCVESVKIFPKRHEKNSLQRQAGTPKKKQPIEKMIQELSAQKQDVHCTQSKNHLKQRQFLIACQRNNAKMPGNHEKPKNAEKKSKKKQQNPSPDYKDYEPKYNLEFQEYFQKCKFEFCGQTCSGGNKLQLVCVQKSCRSSAAHCNNSRCLSCQKDHRDCNLKFSIDMFNKSLQKNLSRQKKTMQIVYETYSNILNEIQLSREKTMKFLCVQGVNQNLLNQLEERYKVHQHISLKSSEIMEVLSMLNAESQSNQFRERKIYEQMRKDEKEITSRLQQQMHLLLEPFTSCELNILNSHLITNKTDAKFVLQNLGLPKDMKLLYRASEHEFSIKKFHQICDKEDNTFTVIKTEFGKLIGGFTPLKWNNKYGRDRSNKTFLLSISMKERLEHIKHGQSAIHYSDSFGPSFGGLFESRDIQIFEQNGLLKCITNFPNAYNWKKFFISNQESWRFLTGVNEGKKCRVMDYEVFKVQFWNKNE